MEHVYDLLTLTVMCAQFHTGAVKVVFDPNYDYYVHASCVQEDDFEFTGYSGYRLEFYDVVPAVATHCGFCNKKFHSG